MYRIFNSCSKRLINYNLVTTNLSTTLLVFIPSRETKELRTGQLTKEKYTSISNFILQFIYRYCSINISSKAV